MSEKVSGGAFVASERSGFGVSNRLVVTAIGLIVLVVVAERYMKIMDEKFKAIAVKLALGFKAIALDLDEITADIAFLKAMALADGVSLGTLNTFDALTDSVAVLNAKARQVADIVPPEVPPVEVPPVEVPPAAG